MRALVVTNMYPTPDRPARGRFVRDQVDALSRLDGVSVEVEAFSGGSPAAYAQAAMRLRRRHRGASYDIVHAHFGLTVWPALAAPARARVVTLHGTDLSHPRSRAITLAALPLLDLVAVVSDELGEKVPRWALRGRELAVLPCGVDMERFRPIDRGLARRELGLDPAGPYLLFPADPRRPEKRFDLARQIAGDTPLLTLGGIDPDRVPLYVNVANAVVVTSDREGFGLAALEALACDVPVLSTAHGIAPEALEGIDGACVGQFDAAGWRAVLATHLNSDDPRIAGRARAEAYSSAAMAARVVDAWRGLLER